jgi:nitrogenase subunit NifH
VTPKSTAVLGKGGAGKTFVAAHLAMAFGYLGVKTLLVGCDQKQDTVRAVSTERRGSLMEWLESREFDYGRVRPSEVLVSAGEYVDVLELGPSQLLIGHYAAVLDEAFHYFTVHELPSRYGHIIFDVTDERWDAVLVPLFRRVQAAVAVTRESPESLFVINRLLRAVQIGAVEFHHPMSLLGLVNNASHDPLPFERYIARTRAFPLLTISELPELAALRPYHRTLFALKGRGEPLERLVRGFVKVADLLRGDPLNLYTVGSLEDEEIWKLPPPVSLPS